MTQPPRLCSVYFGDGQYARMARVLEATARRWCPGWTIEVSEVPSSLPARGQDDSARANHAKLAYWVARACALPAGDQLLLLDADTFVTAPLDELWSYDFDIAITERDGGSAYPINGGVVALRVSPAVRAFLTEWLTVDGDFLRDSEKRRPWRARFGGQNQASLGYLLSHARAADLGVHVRSLPCAVWNCEDTSWRVFSEATRIVHVKSGLRLAALGQHGGYVATPGVRELARAWRTLENGL